MTDSFPKFYDRSLRFLSFRPRSEKEIADFLKKKKVGEATIKKILDKLKEYKFLDDREFARWLIEQRQGRKPRGKRLIEMELKQKGIAEPIIEEAQNALSNQSELAKKALEKKVAVYRHLNRVKAYQKLSQFLLRRGFDWETVKGTIDEILKKEYNTKR